MDKLDKRNTAAAAQSIKEFDEIVREQQIRIDGLVATVSNLQARLNQLEQSLAMMRVAAQGRGPSV